MKLFSIAIDGPAGAGKSTFAKRLAKDLGFVYVDTGAIYRSVGLFAFKNGIAIEDIDKVAECLGDVKIEVSYDDGGTQHVMLNGSDVSKEIRLPEISTYASAVSALPQVREFLLNLQRDFAKRYNVIMDGRDIGTVVLPDADLKIFLSASIEARAKRRYNELLEKNIKTTFEEVESDMVARDEHDSHRAVAPLRQAKDAVFVDTTDLSLEESFNLLRKIVKDKLGI